MGFGISVQHPLLGASNSFPMSHTVLAQTHPWASKETRSISPELSSAPWLGYGEELASPSLSGSPRYCWRLWGFKGHGTAREGPCLVLRGGCSPSPGTPTPPMPPLPLGTTGTWVLCPLHPMHRAGTGVQEPPSQWLFDLKECTGVGDECSQAMTYFCSHKIGYFHPLPIFVSLGEPCSHSLFPPGPGGPVHGWAGVWDISRELVGDPMAPLRNPQPAPETSSRSQREPADLAAASEGGGMKGGREAARDQNEIVARERGWLAGGTGRREGGEQLSRTCRGVPPMGAPWDCCSPNPSTEL